MSAGAPGEAARGRSLPESWPFYAAGAAIVATLLAVYAMLHPRATGTVASAEFAGAAVTTDSIELRGEPSAKAPPLATLPGGTRLRVRARGGRWVEAQTASGERGFLPVESVEADADRDARRRLAKTLLDLAPVSGVVTEDTDVALAPYAAAARGGRLSRGRVVAIHAVDHSYFAFADPKWGIAFVSSASVDLMPANPGTPAIVPEKVRALKNLTVIDQSCEPVSEPESGAAPGEPEAAAPPLEAAIAPEPAPGLLEPPVAISRVEPSYPDGARRAGVEGVVELEVSVDASGRVTEVEVVRGLPLGLSEAAADAVRKWTFRPARGAGGPVASRATVRVRFALRAGGP